jgi:hypothetical protein
LFYKGLAKVFGVPPRGRLHLFLTTPPLKAWASLVNPIGVPMAETRPYPRWALPAVAGLVFLAVCLVYILAPDSVYLGIVSGWGVIPAQFPFLDTHMVLSSRECAALGFDPFLANPCDALNRPVLYSPLMLWGAGPHEISSNMAVGVAVNAAFILSLFCLPRLRQREELALMMLAVLSSASAFAAERGNFELLIFAAAAVAGRLLLHGKAARCGAYGLMLVAALSKFFPAVLFALSLRERPRLFIAVNAVAGAVLALMVGSYRSELKLAAANLPQGFYFGDDFGATIFPYGLAAISPAAPAAAILAGLTAIAFGFAAWLAFRPAVAQAYAAIGEAERVFLAIGCVLMLGAFFAGQSVAYRAIHLIFVLPAFCALARPGQPAICRRLFAASVVVLLFLMWGEFFRLRTVYNWGNWAGEFGFWLLREALWWWLMAVLGGLLIRFVLASEIGRIAATGLASRLPLPRRAS